MLGFGNYYGKLHVERINTRSLFTLLYFRVEKMTCSNPEEEANSHCSATMLFWYAAWLCSGPSSLHVPVFSLRYSCPGERANSPGATAYYYRDRTGILRCLTPFGYSSIAIIVEMLKNAAIETICHGPQDTKVEENPFKEQLSLLCYAIKQWFIHFNPLFSGFRISWFTAIILPD